jgi:hypothetical protein
MSNAWLAHHGIVGMKWGVRRFQNKDGSLTSAGKKRYNTDDSKQRKETYMENSSKSVNSLNRTINKFNKEETSLLKEWSDLAKNSDIRTDDRAKQINTKLEQLDKSRKQYYKSFINDFQKENNVKVTYFQPLKDNVCIVFTDGNSSYQMYKGSKYTGFSETNRTYPNNVQRYLEDD